MTFLLPTFKIVSTIFAISAVVTGIQALLDPISFSNFFGLPISKPSTPSKPNAKDVNATKSYISLMGVRQLGTGITLLIFAWRGEWEVMATILSVIGVVVAGCDGYFLYCSGARREGVFHAVPGVLIAMLAGAVVLEGE